MCRSAMFLTFNKSLKYKSNSFQNHLILHIELIFLAYKHIVCVFRCMSLKVKAAAPEGDAQ